MSLCAQCGLQLSGSDVNSGMCGHHPSAHVDGWHVANRVMCDWVHRGIPPPRLPPAERERDDIVFAHAGEASEW